MTRAPILAALVLAACGTPTPPGMSSGPGITSVSETMASSSTGSEGSSTGPVDDSAGSVGSTAGASTGILHDIGAATDFDPGKPEGCKGKVDLLFLISRYGDMDRVQGQLLASFPGFIQTIEERLAGFDVHIMAANPDGDWPGFNCEHAWWGCKTYSPNCGPEAEDWVCGESVQDWRLCDSELGAGNTFNAGAGAMNKRCELFDGHRYIVSGESNMNTAFECIGKAGWSGGDAAIGDALIAAVSPDINGNGGCNEGFLREEALLVVVIISNNYDESSLSSAKVQYDKIVAAKHDPNAVVMLAVTAFPPKDGEPLDPDCIYDDSDAGNYLSLLEQFPYHLRGDACAPSYAPFFDDAIGMIEAACGSFVPQ